MDRQRLHVTLLHLGDTLCLVLLQVIVALADRIRQHRVRLGFFCLGTSRRTVNIGVHLAQTLLNAQLAVADLFEWRLLALYVLLLDNGLQSLLVQHWVLILADFVHAWYSIVHD